MKTETLSEYLTLEEVARLLRRSRSAVYKAWPAWIRQGVAPIRVGGKADHGGLLFRRSDIEQLLNAWRVGT